MFQLSQYPLAICLLVVAGTSISNGHLQAADPTEVILLWPDGNPPGPSSVDPGKPEELVTSRRRTFRQYTNISVPTLAVFEPLEQLRTGAAVLVCPGGGMQRLAYEHEGLEIADWLNPLGITVFVLKYRVPGPSSTALLDAQRAMGIIRQRAREFAVDPNRIGVMGFSAGGEIAVLLATNHDQRGYSARDQADEFSCRPTNACLIYPGGIVSRETGALRSDIESRLDVDSTPSMFIVHAFSDASLNSFALGLALKQKRISCEMHIYREGGHGFGARESALPLSGWKQSYIEWIKAQGFLDAPFVAGYAATLAQNYKSTLPLETFSSGHADATIGDAFAVQRKLVQALSSADPIVGYKAGPVIGDPIRASGPDGPATGVLFESGRTYVDGQHSIRQSVLGPALIETELGFVVSRGLDISTRISSVEQIKGAFESVVKVIELPVNLRERMQSDLSQIDLVAANIGSRRFLLSSEGISPDDFEPDNFLLQLKKDGEVLHKINGDPVPEGIWNRLIVVVNRIVDQGYTLRSGDIVISGALGTVHPASQGVFTADYDELGSLEIGIQP